MTKKRKQSDKRGKKFEKKVLKWGQKKYIDRKS